MKITILGIECTIVYKGKNLKPRLVANEEIQPIRLLHTCPACGLQLESIKKNPGQLGSDIHQCHHCHTLMKTSNIEA